MRFRQVVRVNVSRPGGGEETLLKTARSTLRSRLLRRFVGDRYSVLVLTPVGVNVESVEIHDKDVSNPDLGNTSHATAVHYCKPAAKQEWVTAIAVPGCGQDD